MSLVFNFLLKALIIFKKKGVQKGQLKLNRVQLFVTFFELGHEHDFSGYIKCVKTSFCSKLRKNFCGVAVEIPDEMLFLFRMLSQLRKLKEHFQLLGQEAQ